ncbi:MAG: hypothetical protein M1819_004795 [Sarea resinae]|nr:MAG: hypothetical protein M1819_004795 [Sarea resinae]
MIHATPETAPTESHALATVEQDEKGVAQEAHAEPEVKDLGWNAPVEAVPAPLVGGLPNEELWVLVRRFNKQMYHVKAHPKAIEGDLDLNIADEEEFSADKLRSNVERLYMTVIVGLAGFGKHIARLRSWRETRRTAAFCAAYYVAWFLNLLMPSLFLMMITLVVYPPSREFLFPPVPLALVDARTGHVKKPSAGVLGSTDSMTGAPEQFQGEAVEQEANNFVNGVASIALSSATGKHPENKAEEEEGVDTSVPDPTQIATRAAEARNASGGGVPTPKRDKTKKPMEEAMWEKARPVMHIIGGISDGWERFGNALSPTAPFPKEKARLKLAGVLAPACLGALLVTSSMFVKATTFLIGSAFFGDPAISRGITWLDHNYPDWQKLLELRNTLLRGVPTNAQLTITLLRIGEANKAPLPPPPRTREAPPTKAASQIDADDISLDVSQEDLDAAIHPDEKHLEAEKKEDEQQAAKPKHGHRIVSLLKGTIRTTVETTLGTDRFKAKVGSTTARNRLGVLPNPKTPLISGPVDFKARHKGKKGHLIISTALSDTPTISFTREEHSADSLDPEDMRSPVFTVAIRDIKELKKIGGLGWKTKLVVGWAMDREVADGLEIVDAEGNTWRLTAIPLREELFNRLVAMGGQRWESW